jgi:uncharacterized membrane protein YjjP (DUF1212 family)
MSSCYRYPMKDEDLHSFVDFITITFASLFASCYRYPIKHKHLNSLISIKSLLLTSIMSSCYRYPKKDEDLHSLVASSHCLDFNYEFLLSISNRKRGLQFKGCFISLTCLQLWVLAIDIQRKTRTYIPWLLHLIALTSIMSSCYRYPIEDEDFNSLVALISLPLTSIMGSYYGNAKKVKNINYLVDLRSLNLTSLLASCYRYPMKDDDFNSFVGFNLLLSLHY